MLDPLSDTIQNLLPPGQGELPSEYADRLAKTYAEKVTNEEKKNKGQFFTPLPIARFMSELAETDLSELSILDPGCGTGVLSISLVESIFARNPNIKSIRLVAYETDIMLTKYLERAFEYLSQWLSVRKIKFDYIIYVSDFVLENRNALLYYSSLYDDELERFDFVISNPPYFKLSKSDERTKAAKEIVNGHANIYSIFMAIAAQLLNPAGQLVFIVPRSFTSGNYFHSFRNNFFKKVDIIHAHLFHSRSKTFIKDKILQETLILKCCPKNIAVNREQVLITSSNGTQDLDNPESIIVPSEMVIEYNSPDKLVFLPTSEYERKIVELFRSWDGSLNKYNIQISTGPVVAFRARNYIQDYGDISNPKTAPLYWLHNVTKMDLIWPLERPNKGQYISVDEGSLSILIQNKNYLFLRRFSSKDDKCRLIAAPYYSNSLLSTHIGVENKLNYIYRPNGHLERSEIAGLGALFNSTLFDQFFRIINGNINVSATELRLMLLPPHDLIKEIGNELILTNSFDRNTINSIVNERLEFDIIS